MGGKGSGRPQAPCGTTAAYQRHRKAGQNCELCKAAATEYHRAKRPRKPRKQKQPTRGAVNRQMVRQFKFDAGQCMDCGLVVDERTIVCFDLDHRNPQEKSFTIAYQMDAATASDMRDELIKCDVVCRNCHAIRTHAGQHHLIRREQLDTHLSLFD